MHRQYDKMTTKDGDKPIGTEIVPEEQKVNDKNIFIPEVPKHTEKDLQELREYFMEACSFFDTHPGVVRIKLTGDEFRHEDAMASIHQDDNGVVLRVSPDLKKEMFRFVAYHEAAHMVAYSYQESVRKTMAGLFDIIHDLLQRNNEQLANALARAMDRARCDQEDAHDSDRRHAKALKTE